MASSTFLGSGGWEIHKAKWHPEGNKLLATNPIGVTVAAVGDDAVIARVHEGVDAQGYRGGHVHAYADGIVAVLDLG